LINSIKQRAKKILLRLKTEYPGSKCSLIYQNPHQLLIATILSAQCTDKQVNKTTIQLFAKYRSVNDFANADIEELKQIIKSTGFYNNKAKSIISSMKNISENFSDKFPNNLKDLISLQGVGRKTANVVLGEIFNIPGIVVDTHVKRLSLRMGLVKNTDPGKIESDLMKIIPKENWIELGHLFIDHGRAICSARNPKCPNCFLADNCLKINIP